MSDIEEPAAKMLKMDTTSQEEELDEGQEEWLSEGILTDDDGNNMSEQKDQGNASLNSTESDIPDTDTMQNAQNNIKDTRDETKNESHNTKTEDIEQALDNMENSCESNLPDDLGAFLIRKVDKDEGKDESELDESVKQSDDDGHSTDELLRMLGEDDQNTKTKELTKRVSDKPQDDDSTEDEEDLFQQGANIRQLRVAKNVIMKKPATRAEPEDMSDEDEDSFDSPDEVTTVKKMFGVPKKSSNVASKSTAKSSVIRPTITVTKKVVTVDKSKDKPEIKTVSHEVKSIKHEVKKPVFVKRELKNKASDVRSPKVEVRNAKVEVRNTRGEVRSPRVEVRNTRGEVGSPKVEVRNTRGEVRNTKEEVRNTKEEVRNTKEQVRSPNVEVPTPNTEEKSGSDNFNEEFLDEELDEELADPEQTRKDQDLMKPEEMDEEVPSDCETNNSEEDSLFDDFPSSDSEDIDEWFTLDIRDERAGDYVPLLGSKAHQLLSEEKERVAERLANLKESLATLSNNGKQQAEQLRKATSTLAELDATLKAS